jgi:DNA topoisomerase-1
MNNYVSELILFEEEDILEPKEEFKYYGVKYPTWSTFTASARPEDYEKGKFNRFAKIGKMAEDLERGFVQTIRENYNSEEGRCSYMCLLMMRYGIRVGNEGSAEGYVSGMKQNKGEVVQTFGVTTLLNKHILFEDDKMFLDFVGKEQVKHKIKVLEPMMVEVGMKYYRQDAPEEKWLDIEYNTLFKYIRRSVGKAFVPKDFRTFCANTVAWRTIQRYLDNPKTYDKKTPANKEVKNIVWVVSKRLGNTPGVAKKNYIDHRMLDWFLAQRLVKEDVEYTDKFVILEGFVDKI